MVSNCNSSLMVSNSYSTVLRILHLSSFFPNRQNKLLLNNNDSKLLTSTRQSSVPMASRNFLTWSVDCSSESQMRPMLTTSGELVNVRSVRVSSPQLFWIVEKKFRQCTRNHTDRKSYRQEIIQTRYRTDNKSYKKNPGINIPSNKRIKKNCPIPLVRSCRLVFDLHPPRALHEFLVPRVRSTRVVLTKFCILDNSSALRLSSVELYRRQSRQFGKGSRLERKGLGMIYLFSRYRLSHFYLATAGLGAPPLAYLGVERNSNLGERW